MGGGSRKKEKERESTRKREEFPVKFCKRILLPTGFTGAQVYTDKYISAINK